jgi:hypothetical protein
MEGINKVTQATLDYGPKSTNEYTKSKEWIKKWLDDNK